VNVAKLFYAGTNQEVDPTDLQRALDAGEVEVEDTGAPIVVKDSSGSRFQLDPGAIATELPRYLASGYTTESAQETADVENWTEALRSPGTALAEGTAQGLSLGTYGLAASQFAPEYAQRLEERKAANPTLHTAGEVLGAAAPAFFTGGSSLGARALAATPAGLLARGAEAAGAGLAGSLLARGVTPALARIAGMAAEGTLDGAVSGVAGQLSEDALGGYEINAERLAASGGLGALFGLVTGGGLGAVGAGVSGLRKRMADSTAERIQKRIATEAAAVPGDAAERAAKDAGYMRFIPDRVKEGWAQDLVARGKASTADEALDAMNNPTVRSEWMRSGEVKEDLNKRLRNSLQEVYDFDMKLRDMGAGELHAENLTETIPVTPKSLSKATIESGTLFNDLTQKLESEGVSELLGKKRFGRLARDVGYFETKVGKALAEGDLTTAHMQLAQLKRAMWRYSENAAKARPASGVDVDAENWVREFSKDASERVRLALEREDIFGVAGRNQRLRNAAWTRSIETGGEFDNLLSRETKLKAEGAGQEFWRKKKILDAGKVERQINNFDNPNSDFETQIIAKHLENLDETYSVFRDTGQVPKSELAAFDKAHAAVKEARKVINDVGTKVKSFNMLDALDAAEKEKSNLVQKVLSPAGLGVVGGFAGGGVGAAIGNAVGGVATAFSSPSSMVKEVTKLEHLASKFKESRKATRAKTERAIRRLAMPKEARRKFATAGRRASVQLFGSTQREKRQNVAKTEAKIRQFQADAARIAEAVAYQSNGMGDVAPKTAFAYAQVANRASQFLASKLPPTGPAVWRFQTSLNKTKGNSGWTELRLDNMAKYLAAIKDPDSVLDDMEQGKLSPASVEAVKAVYPQKFAEMQAAALEVIQNHKKELPFESLVQLSLLLDVEGHPLLNPAIQAEHAKVNKLEQEQLQASQQGAPEPGRPIKRDPGYLERISNL
jgi:hypothetical protein